MYDLEGKLRQREARSAGGLPYEFRALEAVLISVTAALEGEFEGVKEPVVRVLRELEENIDRDKLRHLLIFSKKLGTFEQKARLVRDAIDELLEADDDLAAMYLTAKSEGLEQPEEDHTDVEMLLESYHKVCDEIVQASGNLVSSIRNTEEMYAHLFLHPPRYIHIYYPSQATNTLSHQRQSHPRREPQLADAARPQVHHRHARLCGRHLYRRPLRHEPEELHRRVRPRLPARQSELQRIHRRRPRLWLTQATQGPAREHVG